MESVFEGVLVLRYKYVTYIIVVVSNNALKRINYLKFVLDKSILILLK